MAEIEIHRADALTAADRDDLADVLAACVDGGASLGFHAPLDPAIARLWWERFPSEGVILLAARQKQTQNGRIMGTVQLQSAESANGSHRGEVCKLLVHPDARRQGIGLALMAAVEKEAQRAGKSLLVLDTREGDPSNDLYARAGFQQGGRIPNWARDSAGVLSATIFWYKVIG